MGNGKGKNMGKGRGKKRSRTPKENKVATKVENMSEVKADDNHHCLKKRPTHVRTQRCFRLGHMVECPIHPKSFALRFSECVPCNNADRRQVQEERKDRKK